MARVIREERRQRGVFGWIILILFWCFNAFMLYALVSGVSAVNNLPTPSSEAGRVGASIGTGIGVTIILGIWLFGAVILGLMALLTRGRTIIIERAPAGVMAAGDVDTSRWTKNDRLAYERENLRASREPQLQTPARIVSPPPSPPPAAPLRPRGALPPMLASDRGWFIELAGESNYQDTIIDALRGSKEHEDLRIVMLSVDPETGNPYDANAVRVDYRGKPVGYLPRAKAKQYREALGGQPATVTGSIHGGKAEDEDELTYGVWLNAAWPPRFK